MYLILSGSLVVLELVITVRRLLEATQEDSEDVEDATRQAMEETVALEEVGIIRTQTSEKLAFQKPHMHNMKLEARKTCLLCKVFLFLCNSQLDLATSTRVTATEATTHTLKLTGGATSCLHLLFTHLSLLLANTSSSPHCRLHLICLVTSIFP